MIILIPARKNSKGFPYKNRKLFDYTIDKIPQELLNKVVIYTDDEILVEKSKERELSYVEREHSRDEETTKEMVESFVSKFQQTSEDIVMLYLTYPNRQWAEVEQALETYVSSGARSLLGKKNVTTHPYLCMYEQEGNRGTQVVEHNLSRRQDYPNCFEISHQVCIFNSEEVDKLNNNLYNANTYFFLVSNVPDVDYESDLKGVHAYVN